MPHNPDGIITDGIGSDPAALERNAGPTGRALIKALDRAVGVQAGTIERYVSFLRSRSPEAGPAEIQRQLDKHFLRLATGTGAGVGAAAAVPGIGFITGAAAVGAESLVFLDAAAIYTVASAHVRGVDIQDPERRRALILIVLLGSKGSAVSDVLVGDLGSEQSGNLPSITAVSRFSASRLTEVNSRLLRIALKRVGKKLGASWFGKILPFGVGAVLGTIANRKLANRLIRNAGESLGTPPAAFDTPAPAKGSIKEPKNPFRRKRK